MKDGFRIHNKSLAEYIKVKPGHIMVKFQRERDYLKSNETDRLTTKE